MNAIEEKTSGMAIRNFIVKYGFEARGDFLNGYQKENTRIQIIWDGDAKKQSCIACSKKKKNFFYTSVKTRVTIGWNQKSSDGRQRVNILFLSLKTCERVYEHVLLHHCFRSGHLIGRGKRNIKRGPEDTAHGLQGIKLLLPRQARRLSHGPGTDRRIFLEWHPMSSA